MGLGSLLAFMGEGGPEKESRPPGCMRLLERLRASALTVPASEWFRPAYVEAGKDQTAGCLRCR